MPGARSPWSVIDPSTSLNCFCSISTQTMHPFSAVVIGISIGCLASVAGQKHLNGLATKTCNEMSDTHRLIMITSWVGDAKYCMHTRYLAQ